MGGVVEFIFQYFLPKRSGEELILVAWYFTLEIGSILSAFKSIFRLCLALMASRSGRFDMLMGRQSNGEAMNR